MSGGADLIITTGGVSAGAYEVVKDAFGGEGGRVRQGRDAAGDAAGRGRGSRRTVRTPIITLPGNPVSALVSFEVFIRPALRAAMGLPHPHRPRRDGGADRGADLAARQAAVPPRRARRRRRGTVTSYGPPASHHLRWLASANCLLEIPEDVTEMAAGRASSVWDLS